MKYSELKTKKLKKAKRKRDRKNKAKGDAYVGVLVTAENRNSLIEEFGMSYYDMYKQEMDKEREKFEADGSPEGYEWRFPQITEEELTQQSIEYGKQILLEKQKSLKAYIAGKSYYRWKGETRPVMTQKYILSQEKMRAAQQKQMEDQQKAMEQMVKETKENGSEEE